MQTQPEAPLVETCAGTAREHFTSLEWLVIAIGAQDTSVPLQWSPFGRSLLAMMGGGPQQITSPCLEMLRRTASVARRYGWATPSADIGAFLLGGWSEAQFERMIESLCPRECMMDAQEPDVEANSVMPVTPRSRERTANVIYA
ncbi:hypothetical protein [Novosphingobium sp. P6W]|uniref:hypothetical protein n=1 Tax=Novosphingobium sp. P6W TaxID=1609758 RepID=UPI0006964DEF|nr:hypothetical protein [Novosphingobium sp. P6W]AXB80376.1 hypothetical protein TQ38_027810 [Novosphingobium sp. P6W]